MKRKLAMLLAALVLQPGPALAQETTLRAASAFPEGSFWSSQFERFVKVVNEKGKGTVRIQYLGGAPKVMPAFEVGNNLKNGVIDLANNTSSNYVSLVPEADALKLSEYTIQEMRANGAWAYLNELHERKGNAYFLALPAEGINHFIYLNRPVDKADLKGLKVRASPITRPVVEALGATAITSPPSEVYTMLERNTVDGFTWPAQGIFDFSWQRVTKYRLEPGVYNGDLVILANATRWKSLTAAQRRILQDAALQIEGENRAFYGASLAEEKKKQSGAGMKAIELPEAEARRVTQVAREQGWAVVLKNSPETGPKLRQLLSK
ncbi:MAG TPA: TRAP transporter substrate-binding protein DctP [Burkholderiales bacterium]|nr:TRAP transporter substrate-binding protein DctP [Burkholderiales bacterium]